MYFLQKIWAPNKISQESIFWKSKAPLGIFWLRFPAMGVEDFADEVAKSGLLTLQQTTDLFMYFTARVKPQLSYPVEPRKGLHIQAVHRFQSCAYRSNQWRYRGRWFWRPISCISLLWVLYIRSYKNLRSTFNSVPERRNGGSDFRGAN